MVVLGGTKATHKNGQSGGRVFFPLLYLLLTGAHRKYHSKNILIFKNMEKRFQSHVFNLTGGRQEITFYSRVA